MLRPIPTLVALSLLSVVLTPVRAVARQVERVAVSASMMSGRVYGVVRDERGQVVGDASIVALGATVAAASSDRAGRFTLALPPGHYMLRATREGYLSTFREPLRIGMGTPVERNITLVRQTGPPEAVATVPAGGTDHAHTTLAWRLRHMRRVVLRDENGIALPAEPVTVPDAETPETGLFDRAFRSSVRAASAFFLDTDFDGELNWVTTGSLDLTGGRPVTTMTGSVAYVAIGAPIRRYGDWAVKAALSGGEPASWVMLGEFTSSADRTHQFAAGVSYGAIRPYLADEPASPSRLRGESRSAGSLQVRDRWQVGPGLEVSYGLRVDAYDYLADGVLFSPRVGTRIAVLPRTTLTMAGGHHAVAPGAAEFQPPAAAGLWMPPERSFVSIRPGAPLRAERVGELSFGIEHALGESGVRRVSLRRFRQTSEAQLLTLFGRDGGASQYLTGAVGHVDVRGWTAGFSGVLASHVRGTVMYSTGQVVWQPLGVPMRRIRALVPSAVRRGEESVHDLTASIQAQVPRSATRLSMAYRLSNGFAGAADAAGPSTGVRFAIEVRQPLPYQPLRSGTFEALVGLRNLYRDLDEPGSFYDELLTVSPPLRFIGGIQVRF